MAYLPAPASTSRAWRDSPPARVAWAAVSWALFTTSFALLVSSSLVVLALGGSCASGGPYDIAVECPAGVAAFTPLSIFGGLAAVGVSLFLVRGFGTPLVAWAWPVLFVGLSIPFFLSGADSVTGIVVGVVFAVMGLAPLLGFVAQRQLGYLVVGSCDVRGRPFSAAREPASRWPTMDPEPVGGRPRGGGDVLLSVTITAVAVTAGLALARVLWLAAW